MPKYRKLDRKNLYLLLLIIIPWALLCYQTFNQSYWSFDMQVYDFLESQRTAWLDLVFTRIYQVTGTYFTGSVVLIALITLIRFRSWQEVKALVFATLGILLLVDEVLKPLFDRSRPPKPRLVINLSPDSFPSGHAAGNLVFYFFMSYIIAAKYPQSRKYVYGFSTCLVLLVGFSSIYVKAHWLTDILAGYGFGYCWLLGSLILLNFLTGKQKNKV